MVMHPFQRDPKRPHHRDPDRVDVHLFDQQTGQRWHERWQIVVDSPGPAMQAIGIESKKHLPQNVAGVQTIFAAGIGSETRIGWIAVCNSERSEQIQRWIPDNPCKQLYRT